MISTQYKCIFIRISKVASTSIQHAFMQTRGIWNSAGKRLFERGEFHIRHYDLEHYHCKYPDLFDNYFKFSFVRNPWDRIYSAYNHLHYILNHESAQCEFLDWLKKCAEYKANPEGCLFGRNRKYFLRHITNQLDWLIVDGQVGVDFIGRYENLQKDFDFICTQQRWKFKLPVLNRSKSEKADYFTQYDDSSVELVSKWHEKDLLYFNYTFDQLN